jgi:hypothetical protein
MTVLKPRSHIISVRVSQEELSVLYAACTITGARSVSDLIRNALQNVLEDVNSQRLSSPIKPTSNTRLKSLERRVRELMQEVATLRTHFSDATTAK